MTPEHEYPSNYLPGSHWAVTEGWRILDHLPVGQLNASQRAFICGMITGALMKAKEQGEDEMSRGPGG